MKKTLLFLVTLVVLFARYSGSETDEYEYGYDYDDEDEAEVKGDCPSGYSLFDGNCFLLGPGNGSFIQWSIWYCKYHGGTLVQINSEEKENAVRQFLEENLKTGMGAWLDRVHFKDQDLFWRRTEQSADYIKQVLDMSKPRYMRPIFMSRPDVDGGRVRMCPQYQRRCRRVTFCEATDDSSGTTVDISDYYDFEI